MIQVRRAADRGHFNHGWLDTWHTFSFGQYVDPAHLGFRALRVINEDRIAPGAGFPMHPHRNMEIVTWVLEGALQHRDSLGHEAVIRPGEVQRITAGTGIRHSEFNPDSDRPVHLLQIWIEPSQTGLAPQYGQQAVAGLDQSGRLIPLVSVDGGGRSLSIGQDATVSVARLEAGHSIDHAIAAGRHAWVQVVRGGVRLNGADLAQGDGVALSEEPALTVRAPTAAEVLVFDLA